MPSSLGQNRRENFGSSQFYHNPARIIECGRKILPSGGRAEVSPKRALPVRGSAAHPAKIAPMQVSTRHMDDRRYSHLACTVLSQWEFAEGHYLLKLGCPDYKGAFSPGQFVNLKCDDTPWGRLYRPFSVLGYDEKHREIEIYYHAAGSGTRWLSVRTEGTELKLLLPLGNGFRVPETAWNVALAAGGVGNAPLIFLARKLREERPEVHVTFLMGARKKEALCIPLFEREKITPKYSTDDGSFGHHGSVVELLEELLTADGSGGIDYIACCGPTAMMASLQRAVAGRVPGEASLEERMACGIGACFGCVATVVEDDGTEKRITTCRNGPVIALEKVRFG